MQSRTIVLHAKIIVLITVTVFISEGAADISSIKDFIIRPVKKSNYRETTKKASSTAMDVWYGNRTMIDVLSKEFSDIVHRMSSRPVRSPTLFAIEKGIDKISKTPDSYRDTTYQVSKVEINFFNTLNETIHTIQLMPLPRPQTNNSTVFKVLEPILRKRDF
ncbi:uncharacterized protein LOC113501194 [Trichoplusia ni]|uniref:Uncharacterized protein LOC113501194 n=1 Tax=Trichoplusia ni TaxID=7111 RepID=A0A7E5WD13_TRINI|nr:uncharacterized protein LOC113501194 [Trichoplusia ni]